MENQIKGASCNDPKLWLVTIPIIAVVVIPPYYMLEMDQAQEVRLKRTHILCWDKFIFLSFELLLHAKYDKQY